jgi:hypothetical protein
MVIAVRLGMRRRCYATMAAAIAASAMVAAQAPAAVAATASPTLSDTTPILPNQRARAAAERE